LEGGRYIDVVPDRMAAGRYGLQWPDIQSVVASAIGGENVGETIEGRQTLSDQRALPARIS
jgi:Cu(I)/Ag(I) efflux system membrane protein CusA/SilA